MRWSTMVGLLSLFGVLTLVSGTPSTVRVAQAVTALDFLPTYPLSEHDGTDPRAIARQAQVSAITVARVLYPTGFDGFFPSPSTTKATSAVSSTTTPASSTTPSPETQSGSGSDGNGAARAIAIVVPIALGTVLVLALGGMFLMWRKKRVPDTKFDEEEGHASQIDGSSIHHSMREAV